MKKILVFLLMIVSLLGLTFVGVFNVKAEEVVLDDVVEMRGVWVSTVGNLDFKLKQGSTSENDILKWKTYFLDILDKVEENNLNAIFFQVRPNNDAFYESEYNAWSSYLIGYGQPVGWDPVEWMVKECHARGIEFHAWLNPYRVGTLVDEDIKVSIASEEELNEAKLNYAQNLKNRMKQTVNNPLLNLDNLEEFYKNIIVGVNGNNNILCLNPASPTVIEHIVNTVEEIATKYDVDGIHYDDYFYPSGGFEKYSENEFYVEYRNNGGTLGLEDWRRDNVDKMVQQVSEVVDKVNATYGKDVAFGISPAGIWAPGTQTCTDSRGVEGGMAVPCGSYSSYSDLYADTKKWVEEEWLDYILPQVYSSIASTYQVVTEWWAEVVSKTNCKLYIGTALYNVASGDFPQLEIYNQMKWVRTTPITKENVSGYVYFSYQSFLQVPYSALIFVRQYFDKGAITPITISVENPGTESGTLKCVELTEKYSVTVEETKDAKGYLLYAFDKGEARVFDEKHLVAVYSQKTGEGIHTYETTDKTEKEFVLKTLNLNNEVIVKDASISTTEATINQAPVVTFKDFESKEYYLMGEQVVINVEVSDDTTEDLDIKMYHAIDGETFRDAQDMLEITAGVYTVTWEAFGISEEDNARFKIVVSDGDKITEIYSDYFKVYEKEPVKQYQVIFKDSEGNILKEETVKAGESATAPTAPVKEGYEFTGWNQEYNNVTSDLEITALYQEVKANEEKGCKKDMALVIISLISLASVATLIWKKEK